MDSFIKFCIFDDLELDDLEFFKNKFESCTFQKCSLKKSKFNNSNFKDTVFYECNLEKSDLSDCSGLDIDIMNNRTKGAKVSIDLALNIIKKLGLKIV